MSAAPSSKSLILSEPSPVTIRPVAVARDARWVVRRALIGVGLLLAFTVASAALYHASIGPDGPSVTAAE